MRRAVGQRRRRVHVHPREARGRHRGEGVDLRPQRPQRREELRSLGLRAEQRDLDRREGPTAQLLGELRERRQADHASHRGRGLGRLRGPGVPRVQHLRRALPGEEQRPGVELGHGHEVELERRHDAEVAATALQGPQQVGLVIGVRSDPRSVGEDDVRRGHRARGEAVRPAVPAQPAAERVADDADVGREAVQRCEALLGRGADDVAPQRAGADAGRPRRDVDRHVAQAGRPQQEGVVAERGHRRRAVARELRGDRQAALGGVPHGGDDVVRVLRHGHRSGTLVVEEVERRPVGVPTGIARRRDAKRHPRHALTARPVASARAATRARVPPRPAGATTASRRPRGTRPATGGSGSRPCAAGTPARGPGRP